MARPEVSSSKHLPILGKRRYGRPRRVQKPEDLPLDWEDKMEEWGRQGLSITEVRAYLDMSKNTWHLWFHRWPEFREVVERFLDLSESDWLAFGRANLGNKFFNSNLYMTQMALRFKYPRHLEHQLEEGHRRALSAKGDKDEDDRLEDLFSGGEGNLPPTPKPEGPPPAPAPAEDAEWLDVTDLRTRPK